MSFEANIISAVAPFESVNALYVFGSRAEGVANDNSDYDFAFLADRKLKSEELGALSLDLYAALNRALHSDDIDIVCLNTTTSAGLAFSVVQDGKLLLDREPNLFQFELNVRHDYFDHIAALKRNGFEVGE